MRKKLTLKQESVLTSTLEVKCVAKHLQHLQDVEYDLLHISTGKLFVLQ